MAKIARNLHLRLTSAPQLGYLFIIMKYSIPLFAAAAAALVFAVLTGCETEKLSDTQLSISPSSATVAPGGTVTLTAQGGWDYTWSKPQYGTLSTYNGKKVTYRAPGSAASSTNGTELVDTIEVHSASNKTATATITIKGN